MIKSEELGVKLREGEVLDDLQINGLKIIQNKELYRFTSDAVLLAGFCKVKNNETVCDLGTGSGIIAFLLAAKTKAKLIYGVEIQERLCDTALRSAQLNGLSGRVKIINCDMRDAHKSIGAEGCDAVVMNPPYRKDGSGDKSAKNESTKLARHEVLIDLSGAVAAAARLLKNGGRLYMIHQSQRADEVLYALKENNIAVKRLRLVRPKEDMPPHLVLIEGLKGGKDGGVQCSVHSISLFH